MTAAKKKTTPVVLPKLFKHQAIGRSVIAIAQFEDKKTKNEKFVFTSPLKEKRQEIKDLIDRYNKKASKTTFDKIIKFFTPEKEKREVAKVVAKKKAKNEIKQVKAKIKELKSETLREIAAREAKLTEVRKILKGDNRFLILKGDVYLSPYTQIELPSSLVNVLVGYKKKGISLDPLINFWSLALLNPNPIARTKMFSYLSHQNFIITPNGYIVTYRMVKKTDEEGVFTHARHTEDDKRLYYRPGEVAKMDRKDCDEDGSVSCSHGLHTGTAKFIGIEVGEGYDKGVKIINDSKGGRGTGYDAPSKTEQKFDHSFGNQAIICLVNPMHVVSIPHQDERKMRSCEFYFCKTTTAEEVVDMETTEYMIFDNSYKEFEIEQIKNMLKETKLERAIDLAENGKTEKTKEKYLAQLGELRTKLTLSNDVVNTDKLDMVDIQRIVQSRLQKVK